jgi:quinoprotein glucose dehydrogenase
VDDVNPWLLTPDEYQKMRTRVMNARNQGMFTPPGFTDTVSMPGNQGGSNFGTTAADAQRGMMFVVGVNQVALLKLEDVTKREPGSGEGGSAAGAGAAARGAALFQQNCQACHGANLQGAAAGVPSLIGVTNRMADDAIRAVITGGRGLMRSIPDLSAADLTNLLAFLATTSPNGSARPSAPGPEFPPGPVVARGGAPLPTLPPRTLGPFYPGVGGNAGNLAYPPGVNVPPNRFMSDYGVLASATKPPYTTLTAYDLNTGEIKWQVPNGDHAPTIAAGGPQNTGGLGARDGVIVTKGGLVFHAGGDGKFRAYDEDTGKVLWTGPFTGNAPGVPASFESQGRQYVLMIAGQGSGGGAAQAAAASAQNSGPTGMIAYALPKK